MTVVECYAVLCDEYLRPSKWSKLPEKYDAGLKDNRQHGAL